MSYPVVNAVVSQFFKDNPTNDLPWDHWIIKAYGNYQPFGHTGIDISCAIGTPVMAVAAGRVVFEGRLTGSYADNPWWISPSFAGVVVVIDHGHFIGIYGHLSETLCTKGDWLEEGEVFAKSGNTGASTGPHLHFEVLPDGYDLNTKMYGRVDPTPYLETRGPIATPQEDELSAADVEAIKNHINAVLLGEFDWEGQTKRPGLNKVLIETQKRVTATLDETRALQKSVNALPTAIWWGSTVKRLDANGKEILIPVVQELANIRSEQLGQGEILVEISEQTSAETLANLVADAQVEDVIAELRARLAPKEEGAE